MNYKVKKSAWAAVTPLCVLFFWLIIPLIIMITRIIRNATYSIEFYDDKVVEKSGLLSINEKTSIFTGVLSVSVNQSLFGRIFNYGNVIVDVQGTWDIDTDGIKNPHELKKYLEGYAVSASNLNYIVTS